MAMSGVPPDSVVSPKATRPVSASESGTPGAMRTLAVSPPPVSQSSGAAWRGVAPEVFLPCSASSRSPGRVM